MIEGSSNFMSGALAKFGGHRYCSSRDILFFDCQMIKQDHIIKWSRALHSTKFGGHMHCGIGDIMLLVCHVMGTSPSV